MTRGYEYNENPTAPNPSTHQNELSIANQIGAELTRLKHVFAGATDLHDLEITGVPDQARTEPPYDKRTDSRFEDTPSNTKNDDSFLSFPDIYKDNAPQQVLPVNTNDLLRSVDAEPDQVQYLPGETIDMKSAKNADRVAINALTKSDLESMYDFAKALKANDISEIDKFASSFKENPSHLGDIFKPLGIYLDQCGLTAQNGFALSYAYNDKHGVLSVMTDGKNFHYVRTDGTDPNTPL